MNRITSSHVDNSSINFLHAFFRLTGACALNTRLTAYVDGWLLSPVRIYRERRHQRFLSQAFHNGNAGWVPNQNQLFLVRRLRISLTRIISTHRPMSRSPISPLRAISVTLMPNILRPLAFEDVLDEGLDHHHGYCLAVAATSNFASGWVGGFRGSADFGSFQGYWRNLQRISSQLAPLGRAFEAVFGVFSYFISNFDRGLLVADVHLFVYKWMVDSFIWILTEAYVPL